MSNSNVIKEKSNQRQKLTFGIPPSPLLLCCSLPFVFSFIPSPNIFWDPHSECQNPKLAKKELTRDRKEKCVVPSLFPSLLLIHSTSSQNLFFLLSWCHFMSCPSILLPSLPLFLLYYYTVCFSPSQSGLQFTFLLVFPSPSFSSYSTFFCFSFRLSHVAFLVFGGFSSHCHFLSSSILSISI